MRVQLPHRVIHRSAIEQAVTRIDISILGVFVAVIRHLRLELEQTWCSLACLVSSVHGNQGTLYPSYATLHSELNLSRRRGENTQPTDKTVIFIYSIIYRLAYLDGRRTAN